MGGPLGTFEVYRRSVQFVDHVNQATEVPREGNAHLVTQLRRAASSIPLNIAEGYGRYNPRDKRRFYLIARGSCFECVAAVDLCRGVGILDDEVRSTLLGDLDEIGRMLTALARRWE
jgi:four helix bundle protein